MSALHPSWLFADVGSWALPLLAKVSLVLLVAALASWTLRRASASARHLVWALALSALCALPLLSQLLPRWSVPVLPARPLALSPAERAKPPQPSLPIGEPIVDKVDVEGPPPPLRSPASSTIPPMSPRSVAREAAVTAWPKWAVAVWLAGIALGFAQFFVGTIVVCRAIQRGRRVDDDQWMSLLAETSTRLGVRCKVELRVTNAVAVPLVWGWHRPVVLIPATSDCWPLEQRRAFLLHELAHVARRDCMAQALASLTNALYWPHPLVWWAVTRLRAEAERACDDLVLRAGTDAPEYAQHLLDAARSLRNERWLPAGSSAVVERTQLGDRLLALLDEGRNRGSVTWRSVTLAGGLVVAIAGGLAALQPAARAAAVDAVRHAIAPLVARVVPGASEKGAAAANPKPESGLAGMVRGPDGKPVGGALVIVKPSRDRPTVDHHYRCRRAVSPAPVSEGSRPVGRCSRGEGVGGSETRAHRPRRHADRDPRAGRRHHRHGARRERSKAGWAEPASRPSFPRACATRCPGCPRWAPSKPRPIATGASGWKASRRVSSRSGRVLPGTGRPCAGT